MAVNYAYNYAQIDPVTNMCIGVHSMTVPCDDPYWIEIPVNDPEYCVKYYNWDDGKFYYDTEYTQEFIPG